MNENKQKWSGEDNSRDKDFRKGTRNGKKGSKRGRNGGRNEKNDRVPRGCDTLHNDPSWYEPFPGSTELVARKSFGYPLGVALHPSQWRIGDSDAIHLAFPGIMRIDYSPLPGISEPGNYSSALNTAAHAYYTTVRYAQRGSGTYDDADLMIGTLGVMSLFEFWAFMRRLYGALNMYSASNKYLSEILFTSMGGDFSDFQQHIYDLQGYINNYALKAAEFCMPADFHVVDRRIRMNSNIYVDGVSAKAQMYYFNPAFFWKYDELYKEDGTYLTQAKLPANFTYNDLVNFGNDLYYSLRSSSTLMNMCGDVKNAYGVEGLKLLTAVPAEYMVPILYDEDMILEIQNATVCGYLTTGSRIRAASDTNTIDTIVGGEIKAYPWQNAPSSYHPPRIIEQYINMRKDSPTANDVMRATRLMSYVEFTNTATNAFSVKIRECGTEVVNGFEIYMWSEEGGSYFIESIKNNTSWFFINAEGDQAYSDSVHAQLANLAAYAEKFDYHPYLYSIKYDVGDFAYITNMFGDVENISLLSESDLIQINRYALLGLYRTKKMDTFVLR